MTETRGPTGNEPIRAGSPWNWADAACLMAVVAVAAALRLIHLDQNGTGYPYYAATVRSMTLDWHNFLFAAFDPAGVLGVDKPPLAFWIQALAARWFGYKSWSLLAPQAIEGTLAAALMFVLVRRSHGPLAGAIAGLVLGLTPICVAVDRDNMADSLLVLVLVLASGSSIRAGETGKLGWLFLTAVILGVGFNVKMLAAWVLVPPLFFAFWRATAQPVRERSASLVLAGLVLGVVSLSWTVFVDLTPPARRPYVGDTDDNRMSSLVLGWNGASRLVMTGGPPPRDRPGAVARKGGRPSGPSGPPPPPGFPGAPGPQRMFNRQFGGQIGWLLSWSVLGLLAARRESSWRRPLDLQAVAVLVWGGWLLTYGLLLSLSLGVIHPYYSVLLGPPIAAGAGIGAVALWRSYQAGSRRLPVALSVTGLLQLVILSLHGDGWRRPLIPLVAAGVGLGWLALRRVGNPASRQARLAYGLGLITLGVCPALWSLTAVLAPGIHVMPSTGPERLQPGAGRMGSFGPAGSSPEAVDALVSYLRQQRQGERFLLVTRDIHMAAPIIIRAAEPVVAYGGFLGSDPIFTGDAFARLVESGQARHVLLMDGAPAGPPGPGSSRPDAVAAWVRAHGEPVEPGLWRKDEASPTPPGFRRPTLRLYRCDASARPAP